jgi:predicted permease
VWITRAALAEFMTNVASSSAAVRVDLTSHASPTPFTLELLGVFSIVFSPFILVLLTACANLSNVMFARAIARQREIAVRLSLGASPSRIVRQLLTEGLVIAVLAGFAGLMLASWALQGSTALLMNTLPPTAASMLRLTPMTLDHRVFAFAMIAAAFATAMFALLLAVHASRLPLTEAMRGHGSGPLRTSRLRSAFVVSQVAVSLVLVVSAITLARNGLSLGRTELGYRTDGVVSVNLRDGDGALLQRLEDVLEADPRVTAVAITSGNPLFVIDFVAGRGDGTRTVLAKAAEDAVTVRTRYAFVSPEYFSLLQIPIVRGRRFELDEGRSAARVAVISAATARVFWPGEDPVGKTIRIERPDGRAADDLSEYSHADVIGVVADHISGMVIEGPDRGHIYFPLSAAHPRAFALLARERPDNPLTPTALQQIFSSVSSDPEAFEALPLDDMRALQAYPLQAAASVGSFLGLVALALSISGLYGVLIYTLAQRTREIGIRMALGANASAVVRLVMGQSARLAVIGAAVGVTVAFGAMKVLSAYVRMHNVAWLDGAAFVGGLFVVVAAAVLAAYQPARRATRVDPTEALRADV